eukprot:271202-Chlamydomonas_euryale.AAC.1
MDQPPHFALRGVERVSVSRRCVPQEKWQAADANGANAYDDPANEPWAPLLQGAKIKGVRSRPGRPGVDPPMPQCATLVPRPVAPHLHDRHATHTAEERLQAVPQLRKRCVAVEDRKHGDHRRSALRAGWRDGLEDSVACRMSKSRLGGWEGGWSRWRWPGACIESTALAVDIVVAVVVVVLLVVLVLVVLVLVLVFVVLVLVLVVVVVVIVMVVVVVVVVGGGGSAWMCGRGWFGVRCGMC